MPKANEIPVGLTAVEEKNGEYSIFAEVKSTNGATVKSYKVHDGAKKKPAAKKPVKKKTAKKK